MTDYTKPMLSQDVQSWRLPKHVPFRDDEKRIRELEAENATLRQQVAGLEQQLLRARSQASSGKRG